jgi:hypothetical protein
MFAASTHYVQSDIRDDSTGNRFIGKCHRVVITLLPATSVHAQPCMRSFARFAREKSPATPGKSPANPGAIPAQSPAVIPARSPVGQAQGHSLGMPPGQSVGPPRKAPLGCARSQR